MHEERFWNKIEFSDACWRWMASKDTSGYGLIRVDGKLCKAHGISYELLVGPIPDGLELDHLCRTRECVRPDHLEPVSHRENVLRGENPAAQAARKTHCPYGHEYAGANLIISTQGWRVCRTCFPNHAVAGDRRA